MQQYDSCGVWYSFGDCPDHPALGRTIASRLSRSLHAPFDSLDPRTLRRARPSSILDPPDSRTSKSAAKRESCRNTSDYRTQSAKGQSIASSPVHLPKYGEIPRKSPVFQTLPGGVCQFRPKNAEIIWRLDCSSSKDNTLAEFRSVSSVCPRLEKKLHPSDGVASPEFYFPHGKPFRRPVTGHQAEGPLYRSGPSCCCKT
jgi:hypothetical protein